MCQCLDWAMAKKGKGIFRAKQGLEKNPKYKQIIQRIIQRCLVDTLPDNDAREYLNGKLDKIDKHYKTLEKLDNDISIATDSLKANNTHHSNIEIQILDPDINNQIQNDLNLLQATRDTVLTNIECLLETLPDNNTLVKNRPLEACAELLEFIIHKVQRADMQKVETLPPADFRVKISAYWEN